MTNSVDTLDCFSYSKLALHTTRGLAKNCGKAASMLDYSSCDTSGYPSSVHYLSQFLSNHSNHSANHAADAEALRREPQERRSALVVDDVADVTEMLAVVLTHAGYSVVTAASAPAALKAASESGRLQGILEYSEEPLVSIDIVHTSASSTVDSLETAVIEGKLVRVVSWYDNEWGFSNRMVDTAAAMAKLG